MSVASFIKSVLRRVPSEKQLIELAANGDHDGNRLLAFRQLADLGTEPAINCLRAIATSDEKELITKGAESALEEMGFPV